ncbi:MAG: cyclic nucleotide-binding domain-containing protein [Deltaproteobacteria bacterium]|nr:cyclic nucleotide-binding domain-containing protein [Deltaproteobacteria bacterium]
MLRFLDPEQQRAVLTQLERRTIRQGETLFQAGDPANFMALVARGALELTASTLLYDKRIIVAEIGRGSMVGEEFLVTPENGRYQYTAVAKMDTEVLVLTSDIMKEVELRYRELETGLLKGICRIILLRYHRATDRIAEIFS